MSFIRYLENGLHDFVTIFPTFPKQAARVEDIFSKIGGFVSLFVSKNAWNPHRILDVKILGLKAHEYMIKYLTVCLF